jgi:signal transduction histidine kinase
VIEVKRIVRDLRPSALDQLGLVGAITEFARSLDDAVQVHLELPRRGPALPAAVEVATYRIVTEALTNVVRHAMAASCWLRIEVGSAVDIDVVDDGVGVVPGSPPGVGLAAMRERAEELGGWVTLAANQPHGTRVHVRLPAVLP